MDVAPQEQPDLLARVVEDVERLSPPEGIADVALGWVTVSLFAVAGYLLVSERPTAYAVVAIVGGTVAGLLGRVHRVSTVWRAARRLARGRLDLVQEMEQVRLEAAKATFEAAQARLDYLRKLEELERSPALPET